MRRPSLRGAGRGRERKEGATERLHSRPDPAAKPRPPPSPLARPATRGWRLAASELHPPPSLCQSLPLSARLAPPPSAD